MLLNKLTSAPSANTPDADVNISAENQKKINVFAIRNGWLDELKEELKGRQNFLKALEDAESDVMGILDDSPIIPVKIGESFIHLSQDDALEHISSLQTKTRTQIKTIETKMAAVKEEMAKLKQELYSQFGDSINLENEEEPASN